MKESLKSNIMAPLAGCCVGLAFILAMAISPLRVSLLFLAGMYVILYNWLAFSGILKQSGIVFIGPVLCCLAVLTAPPAAHAGLASLTEFCRSHWYLWFLTDITSYQFLFFIGLLIADRFRKPEDQNHA